MAGPTNALVWAAVGVWVVCSVSAWADYSSDTHPGGPRRCEAIRITSCLDVGYNLTSMPNLVGLELQNDAEYRLNSFKPLIQYGCSSQLQFFLCSIYAPMCTPQVPTPIGPCRDLCEAVRNRCAPVLAELGYPWPPFLNCSRFPAENNEEHMCMEGPGEKMPPHSPPTTSPRPQTPPRCSQYAQAHKYRYINATGTCTPLCQANISFNSSDKSFAGVWMAIWAVVCFAVTMFTVVSFVLDAAAFRYPERAAVHLALCYNLVAVGYLVRLVAGAARVTCHADPELGARVAVTEGTLHTTCALVFLLLYYFSTAASVWWVMLCVSWLMRAWRGWTHEQILRHSSWFHVAAWGIPAAQAIACLVLRKVDSDELTGTCYAGQQNTETLVRFVLVPQFLYLVTGATLVLVVFACLWRARGRLRDQGMKTDKVDVTAARVGVVAVLYMVPATCQVGATFYEYVEREHWLRDPTVRPNMEVFMLKIFMSMAVGIMGGLFLINGRVLNSWKRFFKRFTAGKQPLPPYLQAPHLVQNNVGMHKHPPVHYVPQPRRQEGLVDVHGYVQRYPPPPPPQKHHLGHSSRHKCGSETQV
ncbi:LOW QUALITY PROTEIN: frizzled-4-like [Macrobrachium rosenbergii]|uniref:LOW QUALITY PROTEIN: frizzled-4-like n=1 Tax=Macrobrachium rosenbergii TaxID=79674 RepID=UPI0034D514EE